MSSATLPKHRTAVVAAGPGQLTIQRDVTMPALEHDMAIVRTAAVAINPFDAKMLDYSATIGAIDGSDFAGTIVALGDGAPSHLAVGDRVAGMVPGMDKLRPCIGAFAEYVGAYSEFLFKLPESMSFEEGASLGTGIATAIVSLFYDMKLPLSIDELGKDQSSTGEVVLVAGGATATGTRAIQLLKHAGYRPIATSSLSNFGLVTGFGAEKVFNYRSPDCAADIRSYTSNELAFALDCISLADTTQLCYECIGRAGGRYVSLKPFRETVTQTRPLTIEPLWILSITAFGRKLALDGVYGREADLEQRRFVTKVLTGVQSLLDRGLIDTHPIKIMSGGWEGIEKGVDIIRSQTLSGYKLVYPVV